MSLKRTFVLCCGLLMLSLTHAANKQTTVCDIGLIIPKHFHTSESEAMEGNGNINNRSLSAWKWIPHVSTHRIPSVIFEADCEHHHCTYPNIQQQKELNSVPIYSYMLVLKQDPKNRKCFTVHFHRVTVGCTCVWERSSP
ncbi:interleukin 17a/f2 [Tachysurus fulvidraco]|uniref:interleukin 17a/f2 n=1 Tax=Tachysurus fulvidraco TaxID=1234273 RepID=UPI001FEEACC3|nr:interleukin 17a/f2 [Tachysurus fulvidraco]